MQILLTGAPRSGKTLAASYFRDKLKVPYYDNKLTGCALGRTSYCIIESEDLQNWNRVLSLLENPFHIHIYNEEVESALINLLPHVCLAANSSIIKPQLVISNSSMNDRFIFQLEDVVEILKAKGFSNENFNR